MDTIRLNVRITKEFNEKLDLWTDRLGLSKSQLTAMALQAGLNNVIRVISPEEVLTPEIMKMFIEATKNMEVNNDLEAHRRTSPKSSD